MGKHGKPEKRKPVGSVRLYSPTGIVLDVSVYERPGGWESDTIGEFLVAAYDDPFEISGTAFGRKVRTTGEPTRLLQPAPILNERFTLNLRPGWEFYE